MRTYGLFLRATGDLVSVVEVPDPCEAKPGQAIRAEDWRTQAFEWREGTAEQVQAWRAEIAARTAADVME